MKRHFSSFNGHEQVMTHLSTSVSSSTMSNKWFIPASSSKMHTLSRPMRRHIVGLQRWPLLPKKNSVDRGGLSRAPCFVFGFVPLSKPISFKSRQFSIKNEILVYVNILHKLNFYESSPIISCGGGLSMLRI
jgi:hypothetical protein